MATVLIVDDDNFVRVLLRDAIGDGHRVLESVNGAEAIAIIERGEKPDVVFLDLLMPVKSGLETLPELRRLCPAARVVVVSSMETDSMVKSAYEAGASGFVAKPFHPAEIVAALKRALGAGSASGGGATGV